ncbi:MAG: tRNA pseudouridine(13) synthase TruD, partial [Candidatus Poribacteria bacterium]|nr:tRNA pseudouridine(13) synthase TruD [Candidatus Poribacteria bacterium]
METDRTGLYLTDDLPGIGGMLKRHPEDFVVDEVPLYEAAGEGRHTYLTIEKRGLSTFEAVQRIADHLCIRSRDIGYAGLKDGRAVTTQRISIENLDVEDALALEFPNIRVIDAQYHSNKLRLGHLAGNRFRIRVRNPNAGAFQTANVVMARLVERGAPNFFGMQRFSGRKNGHLIGRAMLLGDWDEVMRLFLGSPLPTEKPHVIEAREAFEAGDLETSRKLLPFTHYRNERMVIGALQRGQSPERAFGELHPRLRKLFLSAYQSLLFNRVLAKRLRETDRLMDG